MAGSGGGTRPRESEDLGFGFESNKNPLVGFNQKNVIEGLWPLQGEWIGGGDREPVRLVRRLPQQYNLGVQGTK